MCFPSGEERVNFLLQMIFYLSSLQVDEGGGGRHPVVPPALVDLSTCPRSCSDNSSCWYTVLVNVYN
jgi:hypothetical protein